MSACHGHIYFSWESKEHTTGLRAETLHVLTPESVVSFKSSPPCTHTLYLFFFEGFRKRITKGSRNLFSYKTKQTEHFFSRIGPWGPGVRSDHYLPLRDFRALTWGTPGCLSIKGGGCAIHGMFYTFSNTGWGQEKYCIKHLPLHPLVHGHFFLVVWDWVMFFSNLKNNFLFILIIEYFWGFFVISIMNAKCLNLCRLWNYVSYIHYSSE